MYGVTKTCDARLKNIYFINTFLRTVTTSADTNIFYKPCLVEKFIK